MRPLLAFMLCLLLSVPAHAGGLWEHPDDPVGGNPNGDVTVIEFFDFQCPSCRAAHPEVRAAVEADGNVRLVYKDWPILGPGSEAAARAALAARYQDGYEAFTEALLAGGGTMDPRALARAAQSAGLDPERLAADHRAHAKDIDATLERNDLMARSLGIAGTPSFLVAGQLVEGPIDRATLEAMIADARTRAHAPVSR